jgi:broad specificity phosphatase PhoE
LPLKKIYLVRHGQTKFNQLGVVQGKGIDASLNETGIRQAEMFYQAYKNIAFEKVYTSSLKRSRESVLKFIIDGIPHEAHAGFDEISWGDHEGADASEDRNEYFKHIIDQWNQGNTFLKIQGGESPEDVAERQTLVMEKILNSSEELILVCMHGRAIRILLCKLLSYPLSKMDHFAHANLGLYILEYSGEEFNLKLENSTNHLLD